MEKQEKQEKINQLTGEFDLKITMLKDALATMVASHEREVKKRQDEIEFLELQAVALKEHKIK